MKKTDVARIVKTLKDFSRCYEGEFVSINETEGRVCFHKEYLPPILIFGDYKSEPIAVMKEIRDVNGNEKAMAWKHYYHDGEQICSLGTGYAVKGHFVYEEIIKSLDKVI